MKKVIQYSQTGDFIQVFPSAKKASESIGLKTHSGIVACCRQYSASNLVGGFQWRYYSENFNLQIPPAKKRGQTFKELYGRNSEGHRLITEKKKQTSREKYGVDHPMKNSEVQKNLEEALLRKYGVTNAAKSSQVSDKISRTERHRKSAKFFEEVIDQFHQIIDFQSDFEIKIRSTICEHEFTINRQLLGLRSKNHHTICTLCNKPEANQRSEIENTLYNSFKEENFNIERNVTGILPGRKEIDILFPDHSIAIEVNGIKFHSELHGKHQGYHVAKTDDLERAGIFLFQFFDDEISNKWDIVQSMIKGKLGSNRKIFARKCEVREISNREALHFFISNHLQGAVNSSHQYGLFHEGKLVSAMSFSKLRKNLGSAPESDSYELLRFSNLVGVSVVGGASKLFNYFVTQKSPKNVLSYANRRWSNGDLYRKLGFIIEGKTDPGYYFFWKNKRVSRHKLNKKSLNKLFPEQTGSTSQILENIGAYKIWDCGNHRCIWTPPD